MLALTGGDGNFHRLLVRTPAGTMILESNLAEGSEMKCG